MSAGAAMRRAKSGSRFFARRASFRRFIEWLRLQGEGSRGPARTPRRHLPENDSSLNGEVSIGDNLGTRIWMKPTPLAS